MKNSEIDRRESMTTIYLIRHSIKEKNYGIFNNNDSKQLKDEKRILSCEGEEQALLLSKNPELQNIDEVWASNYVRAAQTAKYICNKNNKEINISEAFDERHYGTFENDVNKEEFWINQFKNDNLKNKDGESKQEVVERMNYKINEIIKNNKDKRVAIVCHNACILFYILQYCKLEKAEERKKLTISFNDKILIKDEIMKAPSVMKLQFDDNELVDITYLEI